MKYLETFKVAVNKDKIFIEDVLLIYQDSGKILDCKVSGKKSFQVTIKFADTVRGIEKIRLMDSLISRLRRRFKYIDLNKNKISIFTDDRCIDYIKNIDFSLESRVLEICEQMFEGLFKYGKSRKYLNKESNYLERDGGGSIYIYYDVISGGNLRMQDSIYVMFLKNYSLEMPDVKQIVRGYINNNSNIKVKSTDKY